MAAGIIMLMLGSLFIFGLVISLLSYATNPSLEISNFFLPNLPNFIISFLFVFFGIRSIKKYNRTIAKQKEWNGHQNSLPRNPVNPNQTSLNTTTSYSSTTTITSNINGNSTTTTDYKIFNPLDPKTAPYMSWQQQQRNQQMNTSPTPPSAPNLQPKKVDCSGCGAIYTIAPHEKKDCEYCGNTVVYE